MRFAVVQKKILGSIAESIICESVGTVKICIADGDIGVAAMQCGYLEM